MFSLCSNYPNKSSNKVLTITLTGKVSESNFEMGHAFRRLVFSIMSPAKQYMDSMLSGSVFSNHILLRFPFSFLSFSINTADWPKRSVKLRTDTHSGQHPTET